MGSYVILVWFEETTAGRQVMINLITVEMCFTNEPTIALQYLSHFAWSDFKPE